MEVRSLTQPLGTEIAGTAMLVASYVLLLAFLTVNRWVPAAGVMAVGLLLNLLVVASNGARDRHPAWYLNVQANPDVELRAGRTQVEARASVATPEEKARLWPKLTDYYKGWAYYQTQTDREIPVVVLRPS